MQRRTLLAAAAPAALFHPLLRAQAAYPSKPIRLVVGFPPGGGIDFTARSVQPGLEAALGQPVVIDYKPGAGGVLAATELTRAAPDGYTLGGFNDSVLTIDTPRLFSTAGARVLGEIALSGDGTPPYDWWTNNAWCEHVCALASGTGAAVRLANGSQIVRPLPAVPACAAPCSGS